MAHEIFHFLILRKAKQKFEMAIKLDMHKAYDHVEWDFLEQVLIKMGFDKKMDHVSHVVGYNSGFFSHHQWSTRKTVFTITWPSSR